MLATGTQSARNRGRNLLKSKVKQLDESSSIDVPTVADTAMETRRSSAASSSSASVSPASENTAPSYSKVIVSPPTVASEGPRSTRRGRSSAAKEPAVAPTDENVAPSTAKPTKAAAPASKRKSATTTPASDWSIASSNGYPSVSELCASAASDAVALAPLATVDTNATDNKQAKRKLITEPPASRRRTARAAALEPLIEEDPAPEQPKPAKRANYAPSSLEMVRRIGIYNYNFANMMDVWFLFRF
jgi:hypothetical protein